jgi:hypothetical protein
MPQTACAFLPAPATRSLLAQLHRCGWSSTRQVVGIDATGPNRSGSPLCQGVLIDKLWDQLDPTVALLEGLLGMDAARTAASLIRLFRVPVGVSGSPVGV